MDRVYEPGGTRLPPLAVRAEPRPASTDDDPLDRPPAAVARLAEPAVDVELVLHRASVAVRRDVVAERRSLSLDSLAQDRPQRAVEPREPLLVELARGPERMDLRAPERLVRVDVPDAGDAPLVEEEGLDRRRATGGRRGQPRGGEGRCQRLRPEAGVEVELQMIGLEELPGAEPPDVPVAHGASAGER